MKTLSESIIGRRGNSQQDLLQQYDIALTRIGNLMMVITDQRLIREIPGIVGHIEDGIMIYYNSTGTHDDYSIRYISDYDQDLKTPNSFMGNFPTNSAFGDIYDIVEIRRPRQGTVRIRNLKDLIKVAQKRNLIKTYEDSTIIYKR